MGMSHFLNIYKAPWTSTLPKIIKATILFPPFVEPHEDASLTGPLLMKELWDTLKWFKKDKSLGPHGWLNEFYLDFFETLGQDILNVVEHYTQTGRLYDPFNSTFIARIPISESPHPFYDYHPISLCNFLYIKHC